MEVRTLIYLFFCGLSFYIGLHARRSGLQRGRLHIYFGGQTSALLAWISDDSSAVRSCLENAVSEGFRHETPKNRSVPVRIVSSALTFSPALPLGEEVARGLLARALPGNGDAESSGWEQMIPVESGWLLNGKPVGWNQRLPASDFSALTPPAESENSYIGYFVNTVLPNAVGRLSLDPRLLETWRAGREFFDAVQHSIRGAAVNSPPRVPEPIFISELRIIMDRYAVLVTGGQLRAGDIEVNIKRPGATPRNSHSDR